MQLGIPIYTYIYIHIRLSTTFCPDLRRSGGLTHICLQFSNGNIRFQTMHVRLPYVWPGTSNFDQNPYIARMISGSSPCFAWVSRLLVSQKSLLLLINFHFTHIRGFPLLGWWIFSFFTILWHCLVAQWDIFRPSGQPAMLWQISGVLWYTLKSMGFLEGGFSNCFLSQAHEQQEAQWTVEETEVSEWFCGAGSDWIFFWDHIMAYEWQLLIWLVNIDNIFLGI